MEKRLRKKGEGSQKGEAKSLAHYGHLDSSPLRTLWGTLHSTTLALLIEDKKDWATDSLTPASFLQIIGPRLLRHGHF